MPIEKDDFVNIVDGEIPIIGNKSQFTNLFIDIQESNLVQGEEKLREVLKYPLYRHQKIAVRWMKKAEMNENKSGGILADEMGLGKTLSMIGLMLSFKPSSGIKTNLIVAPVSLLKQWERELEEKILPDHQLRVFLQHTKKADYAHLSTYDVVLTSYGILTSELSKLEEYTDQCAEEGTMVDDEELGQICPFLGPKSFFLRVILDEAQYIKNYNSKSAKAVFKLKAKHRWCLSGTPMQNGAKELASLVHFLRIEPYCDISLFKRAFKCIDKGSAHQKKIATKQLQALLEAICLRRSKKSMIHGRPIIELTKKIELVDHAVFNAEEGRFYEDLQKDTRVVFKNYVRAGTVGKNYAKILVMLLRLRQACCHPLLNIADMEFINPDDPEESLVDAAKSLPLDAIQRIKEADAFECSNCRDAFTNPVIMCPCGDYFCDACIQGWLNTIAEDKIRAGGDQGEVKCPTCGGSTDGKFIGYDVFKKVHMQEAVKDADYDNVNGTDDDDDDDDDSEYSSAEDSEDDEVDDRGNLKNFVVDDDVEDWVDNRGLKDKVKKTKSKPKNNAKVDNFQPHMLTDLRKKAGYGHKAKKRYMRFLREIGVPSAKVTKCCEIVSAIQEATQEKIIVFSQWTLLLDILEVAINDQLKMTVCRYDGSMSATKRDSTASEFTKNPEAKIILVSLKAGNAGLNLTAASQVILMDPFWNPYVESQAIDRAHRIGQQRDVTVHRILIHETIEDRIVAIQNEKRNIVESALDEEEHKKVGRLGKDELALLFGFAKKPRNK
ncbi:hypothetical protein K449DRAFT_373523 [Hypoxylon sp. EC38]|nr:hypothetical protein K449DRAFT_373523 [Hypoxylon sp. EC38]